MNCTFTRALSDCVETVDFPVGTAFELTIDGVPARQGVVVENNNGFARAWFKLKSSGPTDTFLLRADFTPLDEARLVVRPIMNFDEFAKRLPGGVRARAGGMRRKRRSMEKVQSTTNHFHPDLQTGFVAGAFTTNRSPGCSPPPSPKSTGQKAKKKRTVAEEVAVLRDALVELKSSVDSVKRMLRKMRRAIEARGENM